MTAATLTLAAAVSTAGAGDGFFTEQSAEPAGGNGRWQVEFAALGWFLGIDGTVGVRGQKADAHATFLDIVDASDSLFGYSGRVEARNECFALYLDGMYDRVTDEGATGPGGLLDIDVTFEQTLVDFGAMWRVVRAAPSFDADVDVYLGGRFVSLSLELDPAALPRVSGDHSWTDPFVGARMSAPIARGVRLAVNGDVGGTAIDADFTWSSTALVAFDFTLGDLPASLMVGYRAIGWDHADGAGADRFTWNVIEHGAIVGFALRF